AYVSLYEGFGLPVLEALACGAVVVASSTTAVSESGGDAVVGVEPSSVDSITSGLRRALDDAALRDQLSANAAAHLAQFTWTRCAEGMVDVYRAALKRPAG
ncbi:MAG TPA: glycosyltransferase, partial [Candidatus Limnocylindrales bacterium]|nr:glycosyltransferase [Candidatus Limnocylindrales bacterium]